MHQNMPNRGCNSQTSASPMTRVYRLHRQYTNTSDNPIYTSTPQGKFQGQRGPQRPTQRWEIQLQGRHGRSLPPERLQAQYQDYMWVLWLMAPQNRRGMQGLRPRMLQLWETWTFLKGMQTKIRLSK